ncbi:MAG: glycosyltransferase [Bacteroidota bacterium]
MKILFFTQNLRAGGRERRLIELFKHLQRSGLYSIELVITKDIVHYPEFYDLRIPLHVIERKFTKKDPSLFLRFLMVVRKFKPDVIHVWSHMTAVYALPSVLFYNIPLINNEIVDSTTGLSLPLKGMIFRRSARVIANSKAGLEAYGAPENKSRVIYNGFSPARLEQLEAPDLVRTRFGIGAGPVIAMVASFLELKDYATYLKAAVKVAGDRPYITFLCVGDGDDTASRLLVPSGMKERILFLGRQEKVESIMNICEVGVLTTNVRAHGEGISNALLEFMALGKPVIGTNHGGTRELIDDGETGFLIDPFDPIQLADKINWLLEHPDRSVVMGARGATVVRQKFSMDAMLRSYQEEYHRVTSNTLPPQS